MQFAAGRFKIIPELSHQVSSARPKCHFPRSNSPGTDQPHGFRLDVIYAQHIISPSLISQWWIGSCTKRFQES